MKNFVLFATALFFLGACTWFGGVKVGSGNIISETREVQGFTRIDFTGEGNLIVRQGDKESLKIEIDDNLMSSIKSEVKDGVLTIKEKNGDWYSHIEPSQPYNLYLTVINLEEINLYGNETFSSEGTLKGKSIAINVIGSSKVTANLDVEDLTSNILGTATFNLQGKAKKQEITIGGTGTYEALKLASNETKISISGEGGIDVNVKEKLDISIYGEGIVKYIGKPEITKKIYGNGKIEELK